MRPFRYARARTEQDALETEGEYLAGGTSIVDLMRLDVMRPAQLVDVNALPLGRIEEVGDVVRIGAMVRNSDLARHPIIAKRFPLLSDALLSGATPQLRNMASVGGNLLQRTRCTYFRDVATACNKRKPGSGCSAMGGWNRMHAILGTSDRCIAVNPSDMNVALAALDASVRIRGQNGTRVVPFEAFHTLPGEHPEIESALRPGELVTHVDLPLLFSNARSSYVKVRDRASFAFALASAAVMLDVRNGLVHDARVALGGIATKPWRSREAERELVNHPATHDAFERAARAALRDAKPRKDNAFKVELARRTLVRALEKASHV